MAISGVVAAIYLLVFVLVYFYSIKETENTSLKTENLKSYTSFYVVIILIFLVQLFFTQFSIGYINDTKLFRRWTSFGERHHIWEYYITNEYVDYPPAYLNVLFIVGKIASCLGVDSNSDLYLCFIRFVPILFDAICSIFIFLFAKKRIGGRVAVALALLSALNPINIFNSTVWGQIDSVVVMLICSMLLLLYNRKYIFAIAVFTLAQLTKPQMIIYAPLLGFTVLSDFIEIAKVKDERIKMLKSVGAGILLAVAVVLIVPLAVTGGNYSLITENYKNALSLYPYATLCAPNLYGAFGANWAKDSQTFFILSYKTWGFIFIIVMSLLIGFVTFRVKDRTKIFYLGAFTVSSIFMFAHGMHERYIHVLFMILLIIYVIKRDPKILATYLLFSMSSLINCTQVLLKNHEKSFIYGDNLVFIINSWVNLTIYAFMIYIFYVALFKNKQENCSNSFIKNTKLSAENRKEKTKFEFQKPYEHIPFVKKDYLIMAILTLLYSITAFSNLGSMNVPENGWYPKEEESVIIDMGKECDIERIYAHIGWIDRHIDSRKVERIVNIETSSDGESFVPMETSLEIKKVFKWTACDIPMTTRYIKLTPDDNRFYLNEIAFFGATENEKFVPEKIISNNDTAKLLIDEQDKVKYEFSWFDGTYFDEIYHPRTAYEYITDRYPYENTHPPLGKVIISWGIMLFGMNPFGWRFFGTLCGVLMVPLTYMMGKKMLKKTSWATLACVMFTFDFMHLSQTRLATIDSYTTFFVMGMYYFMYLFISRSFYNEGFKKTVTPLLLSGIFFGLGAATKWQGIYAGVGLCILFFATLIRRYLEYRKARLMLSTPGAAKSEETDKLELIVKSFKPCAVKMIVCGVLFFVVIPSIIYFMSYLPTLNNEGIKISYFFKNQQTMFNYHSTIEGKHPYMSSWWQWPIDQKPLYASSPNRMFIPKGTAMGITTFGNPLVWWLTIPSLIGALWLILKKKKADEALWTMILGFLAMYLPWTLVERSSFIYHFFPCVIFVVLMAVRLMKNWYEEKPSRLRVATITVYASCVVILFALFYPVLTGIPIPEAYAEALEWLPGWVLG